MEGDPSFVTIGVGDPDAARSFYGGLLDWTFADPPSGGGAVVEGAGVPGGIHGDDPEAGPYLFFRVHDLDAALARVRDLGGALGEHHDDDDPEAVARFGRFALCTDDQGSRFGLHEPPASPGATSGGLSFFELGVDDLERGRAFYERLFGWTFARGPGGGYAVGGAGVPGGMHGGDRGAMPYAFFRVTDVEAALERVRELGGTVEGMDVGDDPETIVRFGRFRLCRDDQGSPFGLHEPPAGR